MWRLLADENIRAALVRGLLRKNPQLDIVHVNDIGLQSANDEIVLVWAAREGRVLLTHDIKTMPPLAYARVAAGQPMPGVIAIPWTAPLGPVIDDLLAVIGASQPEEWEGRVRRVPLQY